MNKKIPGLAVGILLIVTAFSVTATITNPDGNPVAPLDATSWPMFQNNPAHTGYSTSTAPSSYNVQWIYTTGGFVLSSPAVIDGKVYFGSNDNKVYCLNEQTGSEIWSYSTGGIVQSSPTVVNGIVYVGSQDDKLYLLDAGDGHLIHSFLTGDDVIYAPTVAHGKVYFGSNDNKLYCLDASTGAQIWNYTTSGDVTSPAVSDGRVYALGGGRLYCFNESTGTYQWEFYTGNPSAICSPAVADGKVYVGSNSYRLYCINGINGSQIWSYFTPSITVSSTPAVVDGKVYVGIYTTKKMECLDANNGSLLWSYLTGGNIMSSPAVADGKIYFGTHDNKVYCLNALNGSYMWSYSTGNDVKSSAAIANGNIYIGSNDKKIYCFSSSENHPPNTPDQPQGPSIGLIGTSLSYTFHTTDPDGDQVRYQIDWGGEISLSDWFESGEYATISRIFRSEGFFNITARARDLSGSYSNWSVPLQISIYNNAPSVPIITDGPTEGIIDQMYNFTAVSATEPDDHTVKYQWDMNEDDIVDVSTTFLAAGIPRTISYSFIEEGIFQVRVKAVDSYGKESNWSDIHPVTIINNPPTAPVVTAPSEGLIDMNIKFTAISTDPDHHTIRYYFDWDDGTTDVTNFVNSNVSVSRNHKWTTSGSKNILVTAQDMYGKNSSTTTHTIVIQTPANLSIGSVSGGVLKVDAEIENNGDQTAINVSWEISVQGGIFGLINKKTSGLIPTLDSMDFKVVTCKPIIGLGSVKITIKASADDVDEISMTKQGFALFFYLFITENS